MFSYEYLIQTFTPSFFFFFIIYFKTNKTQVIYAYLENFAGIALLLCLHFIVDMVILFFTHALLFFFYLILILVADILLWRRWHVSFGVFVVATVAWLLLEWTSLPFLTICSDVLLILIVLLFLHANYAALRNKYG